MIERFVQTLKRSLRRARASGSGRTPSRMVVFHDDLVHDVRNLRDVVVLRIGRTPDNDVILDREGVSRRHCRISRRREDLMIEDLGSSNGTAINGKRLAPHAQAVLSIGDVVHIDQICLVFLRGGVDPSSNWEIDSFEIDRDVVEDEVRRALEQFPGLRNVHAEEASPGSGSIESARHDE